MNSRRRVNSNVGHLRDENIRKERTVIYARHLRRGFLAVAGLIVSALLMNGLGAWAQRKTTSKRGAQTQRSSAKPQGVEAQANAEATKLFNMFFTKCGDSYYHYSYCCGLGEHPDPQYAQLQEWKGIAVRVASDKVTTADKLNGIQWSGNFYFDSEARRSYSYSQRRWDPWNSNDRIPLSLSKTDEKGWHIWEGCMGISLLGGRVPPDHKPTCETLTESFDLQLCPSEGAVKSIGAYELLREENYAITNKTATNLIVYWIDYNGRRQQRFEIAPNETRSQDTRPAHAWLVANSTGKCLRIFYAPANIVIHTDH
jgi:hypothetical protein